MPGRLGDKARREAERRNESALGPVVYERGFAWDFAAVAANRITGRSELHRRLLEYRDRHLDRAVSRELGPGPRAVLAQAGGCVQTLATARELGLRSVVNWNIQHWDTAEAEQAEERRRDPDWAKTFTHSRFGSRTIATWQREMALADAVLVPSQTVADSFVGAGYSAESFRVVPYGVDTDRFRPAPTTEGRGGPLTAMYVGELGQRKGLRYLFEAARRMPNVSFLAVGWHVRELPESAPPNVELRGATLPEDLIPMLQQADVFVFPSLLDGFGLVVLEALACGLPVICSSGAGGHEVIEHGVDGWVVKPRDVEAMAHALSLLEADPQIRRGMAEAARRKAMQYPWSRFYEGVTAALFD